MRASNVGVEKQCLRFYHMCTCFTNVIFHEDIRALWSGGYVLSLAMSRDEKDTRKSRSHFLDALSGFTDAVFVGGFPHVSRTRADPPIKKARKTVVDVPVCSNDETRYFDYFFLLITNS